MDLATQNQSDLVEVDQVVGRFFYNPLGFVLWNYPWGKPGILQDEKGPDEWQSRTLIEIGREVQKPQAFYKAIKSGHEVGKTALAAWVIDWFATTRPFPQIVATANTQVQLTTKLWRELAKWHNISKMRKKFVWTATKFYRKGGADTWFAAAIPWSKEKPDAFQGTHEKYTLIVYDESATIDDAIWEATDGSISKHGIWLVTGNPTKNTGRFYECFKRYRHRWSCTTVDARDCSHSNKNRIKDWIEDYGEDSDFVRIRVKGEFPRAAWSQFIPVDLVEGARDRKLVIDTFRHAPVVIGVDIARYGDDQSVFCIRQGGQIHEFRKYREKDTMQMAGLVAEAINQYKPQMTFIDQVGIGAGVVDRVRHLGFKVVGINGGGKPTLDQIYHNMRMEMWGKMKEWLETGSIPDDPELFDDLIGPEYGFDNKNRYQLERKEDMKSRGLASPDTADALALTFAWRVPSNEDMLMAEELRLRQEEPYLALDPEAGI